MPGQIAQLCAQHASEHKDRCVICGGMAGQGWSSGTAQLCAQHVREKGNSCFICGQYI